MSGFRIGQGWDRHRLVAMGSADGVGGQGVRALRLGGVAIEAGSGGGDGVALGVVARSDGDVLLHAATDAILSAVGAPDLGSLFPDGGPEHEGRDSAEFLAAAGAVLRYRGWSIENLDATVVLQRPRISGYRDRIRSRMAEILGVRAEAVSVKGKSGEHVDAVGESRAIEAMAVVLIGRGGWA